MMGCFTFLVQLGYSKLTLRPSVSGQFALIENGPFTQLAQASKPIGTVGTASGLVEITRADGTTEAVSKGDMIFQGDTLVTSDSGTIGIYFR